jgi:hypothetical protein
MWGPTIGNVHRSLLLRLETLHDTIPPASLFSRTGVFRFGEHELAVEAVERSPRQS